MIRVIRSKPFRISIMVLAFLTAAYLFYVCRIDKNLLLMPDNHIFFDRNSEMLRFIPDKKGERHIWVSLKDVPNMVRDAFISAEDRKFYIHYGFDPIAILRAGIDNIENRRIVSGASTITQQVVRLIYPRKRRYKDKFIEILRSAYLEFIKGKYLNRVPLGNNIVGIELASKAYFGKSSKNLTASEAAILAALPKSPGYLNPYGKNIRQLIKRRGQILSVMRDMGYLTEDSYKEAIAEEPVFKRFEFPNDAPHLVDMFIKNADIYSSPKGYVTTIDINIQKGGRGYIKISRDKAFL